MVVPWWLMPDRCASVFKNAIQYKIRSEIGGE